MYGREGEREPPYSFPSHSIPRIPFRPGIEWRRNRVRPFPDHNNKNECHLDRGRLKEETSPNAFPYFIPPCRSVRASMRLFLLFRLPPFLLLLLQPFSFLLLPRWSPAAAFFPPPPRVAFCFQRTRCLATHSGRQVRLRNENERTRGEGSRGSLLKKIKVPPLVGRRNKCYDSPSFTPISALAAAS